ncbi:hypothetical protein SCHPADRAFT_876656 [Schizopora paradoxa]|uniref:Small ribosomal subunit protein mS29 n=1 Tax=Schizopora paradoxa TaxID=27342 RepID=A0A0H2RI32_9AGAM|nr:hypothetical protein SCHPADRAFT_876656 [Schizopora paradoxa]
MLSRSIPRNAHPLRRLSEGVQQRRLKHEIGAFRRKKDGEADVKRQKATPAFKPMAASQVNVPPEVQVQTSLPAFSALSKGNLSSKQSGSVKEILSSEFSPAGAYGLPRNILVDFRLLSRPCSVVREATVDLVQRLEEKAKEPSSDSRFVLTGASGCGKSYVLLQTVTQLAAQGWIVLYIPRAHKLVDSSTSYVYDPRTQTYLQPVVSHQILRRFQIANAKALKEITLQRDITFDKRKPIAAGTNLSDVIDVGLREQNLSPTILSGILEQLESQDLFPVLLAVDGFQSLYCRSSYRNQHFQRIQSFHLSVPRLLLEYASGKRSFKLGAFVGAPTMNDTQFPLPDELRKTIQVESRPLKAYSKLVPEFLEYSDGLQSVPIPEKLTVTEAAAMFEIWGKDGALHSRANDELFLSKYSEASGNARNFVHGGLLASLV